MSTPLNELGIGNPQPNMGYSQSPNDDSMIDQVVQNFNVNDEMQNSNIDNQMMHHSVDPSQIPPNANFQQYLDEPSTQNHYSIPIENNNETSWMETCQQGVKAPLIVFLLAFVINLPQVTRLITQFIPFLLKESGQLNLYGVLFKAFSITLLFSVINWIWK